MTEVITPANSAVAKVTAKRGPKPVLLKNGKPLAEAKKEAKAAVSAAKGVSREANAVLKAAQSNLGKLVKAAEKATTLESKVVNDTKLQAKDKAGYKAAVTAAKAATKLAQAAIKTAEKEVAAQAKAAEKANAGVTKAEAAFAKLEASVH